MNIPLKYSFRLPQETIIRTEMLLTMHNPHVFSGTLRRFVTLACGHVKLTRAMRRAHCSRCQRMLDSGQDWDGFRHLGGRDVMSWPEDPCRELNESRDFDK
jgi:hypothetical protein